jgi:HPr kinase/phosphorylase
MTVFTVLDLLDLELKEHDSLNLRCIGGRKGLGREISLSDLNRPMGAIMGFYDEFAFQRVQVFGRGETACLKKHAAEGKTDTIEKMFSYPMPCCIFANNLEPDEGFMRIAEAAQCPILISDLSTSDLIGRLFRILSDIFSPQQSIHGVLLEVYGVGILLQGDSGVGKSETALELIKNGHRLVADDWVTLRCVNGNMLVGTGANKYSAHHMEIRGLGLINITNLFGVGAIRERKQVQLVVKLEDWNPNKDYDRLGSDDKFTEFLGVNVHTLEIPVKPGRNIRIIIETAAMNERLKTMGYNAYMEFTHNIMKWVESENTRAVYFGGEETI